MNKQEFIKIINEEGNEKTFRYENYKCKIIRNDLKAWCGYIYIPKKLFEKVIYLTKMFDLLKYNNKSSAQSYFNKIIDCHGGITYFNETKNGLYIIGFDCCHYNDICLYNIDLDDELSYFKYKNKKFVINECKKIIQQIKYISKHPPILTF